MGNTVIAYVGESSAGDAVAALKARPALEALVKRDGQWQKLPATQLVPGDRVRLDIGAVVPADNKWFTRLVVAAAVIDTLESLNLRYPELSDAARKDLESAKQTLLAE